MFAKLLFKRLWRLSLCGKCAVIVLAVLVFIGYFTKGKIDSVLFDYGTGNYLRTPRGSENVQGMGPGTWKNKEVIPHLAVAICGDRLEEPMTMLKSAVLFTKSHLVIHVFSDSKSLQMKVKNELDAWPSQFRSKIDYNLHDATFPADVSCQNCSGLEWKSFYQPCATQRLFLADALPKVDSILYVDADTLFLAPIEELWAQLYQFNSTQFVAAVPVNENHAFAPDRHGMPMHGANGINSGVLLMNLTRSRSSTLVTSVMRSLVKYNKLVQGDQELINIFMHHNPEHAAELTCDWNYRKYQCALCKEADQTGVALLHGFMHSFKNNIVPIFKAVYSAFQQFKLGKHNIKHDLLQTIKRNLEEAKTKKSTRPFVRCHLKLGVYTKRIEAFIRDNLLE